MYHYKLYITDISPLAPRKCDKTCL